MKRDTRSLDYSAHSPRKMLVMANFLGESNMSCTAHEDANDVIET